MAKYDVTFETKCWENDFKLICKTNYVLDNIKNCNYPFKFRQLIINNVNDKEKVFNLAKKSGLFDEIYFAEEECDDVLKKYEIEKSSFGVGYKYSISELVGIDKCKTKYLLHFSSDSYIPARYKNMNWIEDAIDVMEKDENIIVANPTWNEKYEEALKESTNQVKDFYISLGFSDQCYLINVDNFRKCIYNYGEPVSKKYPKHGGNSFEKRVYSYMEKNGKNRITSKNISYISRNITKRQYYIEKLKSLF